MENVNINHVTIYTNAWDFPKHTYYSVELNVLAITKIYDLRQLYFPLQYTCYVRLDKRGFVVPVAIY